MSVKSSIINWIARLAARILVHPQVEAALARVLSRLCEDESIKANLWSALQYRPIPQHHWAHRPNSIEETRYQIATQETAIYVLEHMSEVPNFAHPYHVLNLCLDEPAIDGEILEFGVYTGGSINHIATKTTREVHGFDSFQGLPEQWGNAPMGAFNRKGKLPDVAPNVVLHAGWFEDTLPDFLAAHGDPISLLHIDCDLYSSTRTVLLGLRDQIVSGTQIVFDEYFNYPGWQEHEYKAFQEFILATGKRYQYIGYTDKGFNVAVQIL